MPRWTVSNAAPDGSCSNFWYVDHVVLSQRKCTHVTVVVTLVHLCDHSPSMNVST